MNRSRSDGLVANGWWGEAWAGEDGVYCREWVTLRGLAGARIFGVAFE